MAGKKGRTNRNPSPATRFKKGHKSTGGLRKGIVAKKVLREWTQATVAQAYKKYMNMEIEDLKEASEDTSTLPAIEVIVARALLRDRLEGEMDNTERILDRAIGRVPQKTEMSGINGQPLVPPTIIFQGIDPKQEGK